MIYILMDSSLTEEERREIAQAAEDNRPVFPGIGMETVNPGQSAAEEKIRKNMDTFIEGTQQESGKYDATRILKRMKSMTERRKEATAILLFIGRDLCLSSQKVNWCLGAGTLKGGRAVCSVFHYRGLTAQERLRCIRRTMRHEIGHTLGLAADLKRKNTEKSGGPHCTAPGCSMRQTGNLKKLLAFSLEEEQREQPFCPDCLEELRKRLHQQ